VSEKKTYFAWSCFPVGELLFLVPPFASPKFPFLPRLAVGLIGRMHSIWGM
jgi:hypothetical protein